MRHEIHSGRPRRACSTFRAGAAAFLAVTAIAMAGCSRESGATEPPSAPTPRPVAAPTTQVTPMAASTPVRVQIPAIGVNSGLMALGLQADGTLQVPPSGFPAGWYTGAPTPGQLGPAIIVGHIDWGGHEGVFYHLRDLRPGDEVAVARVDGTTATFRVTQVQEYPKRSFPTNAVYGDINHPGLRLITCGGAFDQQAHSYVDDTVVYADLVGSRFG
jgi:sortase (surface protein transpeptidase)